MKQWFRRGCLLCAAALLLFTLSVPALAAIPERPQNQYVLDAAGVLSDATEQEIISQNEVLFRETGAQIAVAAVDFLDGMAIDDYTYAMFNAWGVGSVEHNNGLLLVLAIGEEDYYAMPGYGIEDLFTGSKLDSLLYDCLEPDFAAGDYDAGVRKFFSAALSEVNAYYRNSGSTASSGGWDWKDPAVIEALYEAGRGSSSGAVSFSSLFSQLARVVVKILVIALVVSLILRILRAIFGNSNGTDSSPHVTNTRSGGSGFFTGMLVGRLLSGSRRRGYRAAPPPPGPPRSGAGPRSGFGGFSGGGRSGGFSGSRRSSFGGSRSGGGFRSGGGSRGGGAGRRR